MQRRDDPVPGPERDLVGYGRDAPVVRWPGGARVAVSLVLNWEEGSEYSWHGGDGRSEGLGEIGYAMDPRYRDLSTESVYEYGSRTGVWRVQRLLDQYGLKCTLFGTAGAFEAVPEVGAWVREAGHEVCCHGLRWEEVWTLSREEEKAHIEAAVASIENTCGERPRGWYCRYGPSVHTRELLVEEGGFVYDSDAYNDDLPYYTRVGGKAHLVVPYTLLYNDIRFIVTQGYSDPTAFLDTCKRGLDYLWDEGQTHPKLLSIGLHARLVGQAGRASALKEFIEYALAKGDVWFPRRIDIAEWWKAEHAQD